MCINNVSAFLIQYAADILRSLQTTVMLSFGREIEQIYGESTAEQLLAIQVKLADGLLVAANKDNSFEVEYVHLNADKSNQITFTIGCEPVVRTQPVPEQVVEVKDQVCNGMYITADMNEPKDYETKPGVVLILRERMDQQGQCHERMNLLALWSKEHYEDYIGVYDKRDGDGGVRTNVEARFVYKLPMTGQWVINAWSTLLSYQHVNVFYTRPVGKFYIGSHERLGEASRMHGSELHDIYELAPLNRPAEMPRTMVPVPQNFTLSVHAPLLALDLNTMEYVQMADPRNPVVPRTDFCNILIQLIYIFLNRMPDSREDFFMDKGEQADIMVDVIRSMEQQHLRGQFRIDQGFWEMASMELRHLGLGGLLTFFQYNEVLRERIGQRNASIHVIPKTLYDTDPPIKNLEGDRVFIPNAPNLPNLPILRPMQTVRVRSKLPDMCRYILMGPERFYHNALENFTGVTPALEMEYLRMAAVRSGMSFRDLWTLERMDENDEMNAMLEAYTRFLGVRVWHLMSSGAIRGSPWGAESPQYVEIDEQQLGNYRYSLLDFNSAPYTQLSTVQHVE